MASLLLGVAAGIGSYVFRDEPPPPPCDLPAESELKETVASSAAWMQRALQANNRFWYEYDRSTDTFARNYFDVRHAGVVMSLYQVAATGDLSVLETADGGLQYILDNLNTVGDITAFDDYRRDTDLGSTALAVNALVHRRIATNDDSYDDLLRAMGRYMQSLLRPDGGMWFRSVQRWTRTHGRAHVHLLYRRGVLGIRSFGQPVPR